MNIAVRNFHSASLFAIAKLRASGEWSETGKLPDLDALNAMAKSLNIRNSNGIPITFVPQPPRRRRKSAAGSDLPGYEARIFTAGEVQTRSANLHDYFNALVWFTYPAAKAALNFRHHLQKSRSDDEALVAWKNGRRTPCQDALSLFDEGGILVISPPGSTGPDTYKIFGHALLELIAARPQDHMEKVGGLGLRIELKDGARATDAEIDQRLAALISSPGTLENPSEYPTIPLRLALP